MSDTTSGNSSESQPAKTIIVTGGSSGIGLSIAQSFQTAGWRSVSWDLQAPPAESDLGFCVVDVSDEAKVQAGLEETVEKYGAPSVLVNNCGLQFMSPVEEFPVEKWNLLIGVMLTGTFLCSKAVIPSMKKNGWGRIINISSVHGKLASPFKAAYVSAKHGCQGLSKVMAIELAEHGITVNSICPGFVDTPLMRKQVQSQMELNNLSEEEVLTQVFLKNQHVKKLTQPQQVADMVQYLCSNSASTITGEAYNISGGWGM